MTLTETPECVEQLCDEANAEVGCDLHYRAKITNDRFEVADSNGCSVLVGTAVQLFYAIGAYQAGYVSAQHNMLRAG